MENSKTAFDFLYAAIYNSNIKYLETERAKDTILNKSIEHQLNFLFNIFFP